MALWGSRVRVPSGPPHFPGNSKFPGKLITIKSEWYRGTPFVSEREGFFILDWGFWIFD